MLVSAVIKLWQSKLENISDCLCANCCRPGHNYNDFRETHTSQWSVAELDDCASFIISHYTCVMCVPYILNCVPIDCGFVFYLKYAHVHRHTPCHLIMCMCATYIRTYTYSPTDVQVSFFIAQQVVQYFGILLHVMMNINLLWLYNEMYWLIYNVYMRTHARTRAHTHTHTHLIPREGHKHFRQHFILQILLQLFLIQVVMCFMSASKE